MFLTTLLNPQLFMVEFLVVLFWAFAFASSAAAPKTNSGEEYHTRTRPGTVAPICLIGGAGGRMEKMALKYFGPGNYQEYRNEERGILTFTGYYKNVRVTLATSGMGVDSLGIILPELIRCGARIFVRVGTCGSFISESQCGDAIIVKKARAWDGSSILWVPWGIRWIYRLKGFESHPAVLSALQQAVSMVEPKFAVHVGTQGTTSDFNTGQCRPGLFNEVPWNLRLRFFLCKLTNWIQNCSMEMSGLLAFCLFKAGGLPGGGIEAIVANRITNVFADDDLRHVAEDFAGAIALEAVPILAADSSVAHFVRQEYPKYPVPLAIAA